MNVSGCERCFGKDRRGFKLGGILSASYVRVRPRMAVEKCHGDIRIMSTGLSGLVPSAWGPFSDMLNGKAARKEIEKRGEMRGLGSLEFVEFTN